MLNKDQIGITDFFAFASDSKQLGLAQAWTS